MSERGTLGVGEFMMCGHERQLQMRLLGGFALSRAGTWRELPKSAERLLALLALAGRPVSRLEVCASLWPHAPQQRAAGSLRWLLSRTRDACDEPLVEATATTLCLAPSLSVDYQDALSEATELVGSMRAGIEPLAAPSEAASNIGVSLLCDELLPDWTEPWVVPYRARFHALRLDALEILGERLLSEGRVRLALKAALAAAAGEPLRESAHRLVIRSYLAQGNEGAAVSAYLGLRRLLLEELGLEPSIATKELVAWLGIARTTLAG